MKVLIHEPFHAGHSYAYVRLLATYARACADVVVCLGADGRDSAEFATYLHGHLDGVTLDCSLPSGRDRVLQGQRIRLGLDFRRAVARHRPDHVLLPSGDAFLPAMGRLSSAAFVPAPRVPIEIGLHGTWGGSSRAETDWRGRFRARRLARGPWAHVHVVNPALHAHLAHAAPDATVPMSVAPHPVLVTPAGGAGLREALGVPASTRLIGMLGVLDERKAVVELAAAVGRVARRARCCLLLAGSLSPRVRQQLEASCAALLASRTVILMNQYLDATTYAAALDACDVIAPLHLQQDGLSSVLLEGVAAGRPILSADSGWCGTVIEHFGLGATCSPSDGSGLDMALLRLTAGRWERPRAREPFLEFHSARNFVDTWLALLRQRAGLIVRPLRTWAVTLEETAAVRRGRALRP